MDPNLFQLNYERLLEVLIAIVFLSLVLERGLALLFESRLFIEKTEDGKIVAAMKGINEAENPEEFAETQKRKKKSGLKELITFVVAVLICFIAKFDAITIAFVSSETTGGIAYLGYVFTGAVIAGGSKGSIMLFKDWIGFMSSAEKERLGLKK